MHIGIHRGAQQQGNLVLLTQFPADFYEQLFFKAK